MINFRYTLFIQVQSSLPISCSGGDPLQTDNNDSNHDPRVILIAEGHEILQESLKDLVMMGLPDTMVLTVHSGIEAVWLSRERSPAVVILDIDLPGLSGIDAARIIHDNRPDISIVLIHAADTAEYQASAIAAGARGYVTKNKIAAELVPVLKKLLSAGNRKMAGKA